MQIIFFDSSWQNEDGTLKELTREDLRALSVLQRDARERAQQRERFRRCQIRCLQLSECEREALLSARRARAQLLRARRERAIALQLEAARLEAERRERARTHPAFPPPPGASVDMEIRLRILRSKATGRRPACGVF